MASETPDTLSDIPRFSLVKEACPLRFHNHLAKGHGMRTGALLLGATTALLLACTPSVNVMRYTEDVYPPTTEVEVLQAEPDRAHINLAELAVETSDDAVLHLKKKAREIGADAIILLGQRSDAAIAIPVGELMVAAPVRRMVAVAIKYEATP